MKQNFLTIIYIDDYKRDEQEIMNKTGLNTYRADLSSLLSSDTFPKLHNSDEIIFRGPRISIDTYKKIWKAAKDSGRKPVTSPHSFLVGCDFELQYSLLKEQSPKAIMFKAFSSDDAIATEILSSDLSFPIFIRSNIESAAKYVGVEGCIVNAPQKNEIFKVLNNLREHVNNFELIIIKELLPIAKMNDNGPAMEYRIFGAKGVVIAFDYNSMESSLPATENINLNVFAEKIFRNLSNGGADGAMFADVAILQDGRKIVVECKNFLNGSIRYPDQIAIGIMTWLNYQKKYNT